MLLTIYLFLDVYIKIFYRYTHIQNLLDVFIFQNPIQPIKYFEYYSEKLKKYYNKSYPDPDLDFLNNIEKNICKKIMDIYKVLLIKHA